MDLEKAARDLVDARMPTDPEVKADEPAWLLSAGPGLDALALTVSGVPLVLDGGQWHEADRADQVSIVLARAVELHELGRLA